MVSLGVVARLPQSGEEQSSVRYFVPSALTPTTAGRCPTRRSAIDSIVFLTSGMEYIPSGVFPATVTSLLADQKRTIVHDFTSRMLMYFSVEIDYFELRQTFHQDSDLK